MTKASFCQTKYLPFIQPCSDACLACICLALSNLIPVAGRRKRFVGYGNDPTGGDTRKQFFISHKPKSLPTTR